MGKPSATYHHRSLKEIAKHLAATQDTGEMSWRG
jgi:hypothetical protein